MDPIAEYTARREAFHSKKHLLAAQFVRIGNLRLAVALAGAVIAWFVFVSHQLTPWTLVAPAAAFIILAVFHQKIARRRTLATRAIAFYDRGLARLNDEWAGKGISGERFRDASHVYSEDLDLFGKGSLFDLIALARTTAGEDTLANWLLHPASLEEATFRQESVRELAPNLKLREELALLAQDVSSDVRVSILESWGQSPTVKFPLWLRPVGILLAILGIAGIVAFFTGSIPLWPLVAVLAVDAIIIFTNRARVSTVLDNIESGGRDLRIFSALVERLEAEHFSSPQLKQLRGALATQGKPASQHIAALSRLVDWLDSGDHVFVRVLRPIVLWREQLAISSEKWRATSGPRIGPWLHAVAEFEALSSFAALAYERPSWQFPTLVAQDSAIFTASGLRHPLIAPAICIPNDLSLGDKQRLLVISGSNMSGKSTLLRAVGLNAVLAWAGAPTAADSLVLSPLQIGASIRVSDSLQDHKSRFFAEITRLRQVVDLTKNHQAVLFLLDELLSGTNSHDRRIGAAGIVKELLRANTIGLLTTHDLALAHIEHDISASIANVHFEDQMNGNEMIFDYKLKPGVVTRSNAIALMRAVGLEV
jgi:hypothetical protein